MERRSFIQRAGIAAIGADVYTLGSKSVGSVLIERMKLAGS